MDDDLAAAPARTVPADDVNPSAAPPTAPPPRWSPVVALGAGIAALVASEFLPAAVLPAMAGDLGVSQGTAGLAVAATSVAGAFTAPTIAGLLPRTDRRTVIVGLLVLAAVANLAVAVAPTFAVLLLGRLLIGVSIAGYWSFAFGAGTHAVPGRAPQVSTAIALGVTVATVVAVPLASLVGDLVGWRTVFAGAVALTAASAVAVARTLPAVPAHPSAGFTMMREALRNTRLVAGISAIGLVAFGNFAAYPFIRVVIEDVDAGATSWLLLAWGMAGLAGNLVAGRLAGHLRVVATAAPLLLATSMTVAAIAGSTAVLAVAVVVWGFAFNMIPVATQLWVTRAEPQRAESALSLQVTAFQVAITAGAASGGVLLDVSGPGAVLVLGAVAAALSGVLFAAVRIPRT